MILVLDVKPFAKLLCHGIQGKILQILSDFWNKNRTVLELCPFIQPFLLGMMLIYATFFFGTMSIYSNFFTWYSISTSFAQGLEAQ